MCVNIIGKGGSPVNTLSNLWGPKLIFYSIEMRGLSIFTLVYPTNTFGNMRLINIWGNNLLNLGGFILGEGVPINTEKRGSPIFKICLGRVEYKYSILHRRGLSIR